MAQRGQQEAKVLKATLVPLEQQDLQVRLDPPVPQDRKALKVQQGLKAHRVFKVSRDQPDHKVLQVLKDRLEYLGLCSFKTLPLLHLAVHTSGFRRDSGLGMTSLSGLRTTCHELEKRLWRSGY